MFKKIPKQTSQPPNQSSPQLTTWHLFHEYLNEAILTKRTQILDNVLMFEMLVQSYFLMQRLGVPGKKSSSLFNIDLREGSLVFTIVAENLFKIP